MNVIQVRNLSKTYEYYKKPPGLLASVKNLFRRERLYIEAVKNISFDIKEGELVGFLGPNGAGKTTTLKMLSGILYPTSGEAKVLGYIPWKREPEYQKQFAIVLGQKQQLWWDLPAYDTFILNKEIYEVPDKDFSKRLDELTELLDIKGILNVQVRKLSLGERMKCELVAALLHQPKILFLDEPTLGLDVMAQKKMREFIRDYNRRHKTTILLTSHYMEDIEELCQRVILIDKGKIIFDGLLSELVSKYVDYKVLKIILLKPVDRADVESFGKIVDLNKTRAIIQVPRGQSAKIASQVLAKLPVDDIMIDEVPIEDVVRKVFGEK